MSDVCIEERFLFDLQGFLILRGVLSPDECAAYLEKLYELEKGEYADEWKTAVPSGRPTKETNVAHQIRLNGLPRLDPRFIQSLGRKLLVNQVRGGGLAHRRLQQDRLIIEDSRGLKLEGETIFIRTYPKFDAVGIAVEDMRFEFPGRHLNGRDSFVFQAEVFGGQVNVKIPISIKVFVVAQPIK